jgi:hypothetical protein
MEDPLDNKGKVKAFLKKKNITMPPNTAEEKASLIRDMIANPAKVPRVQLSIDERNEMDERHHYIKSYQREKAEFAKMNPTVPESDSDSDTEQKRQQNKKRVVKKRQAEIKNYRRKTDRPEVFIPPDQSEEKQVEKDIFVEKSKADTPTTIKGKQDLKKHGLNPEDGLLVTHPHMSRQEMSKLNGKDLQAEDAKNPLPLQRFFYMEKKDREMHGKKNEEFGDEEEFESGLLTLNFSVHDMSMIVDRLKKGVRSWVPQSPKEFLEKMMKTIEIRPRKVEDAYLRTPLVGERPCISDENCEGMKIKGAKKCILVELLTTDEQMRFAATGELPSVRKLCVMCQRYLACYFYVNMRAECSTLRSNSTLSKHSNIPDKEGEYILEQMIMSSSTDYQGLPPVVLHCRYFYKQEPHQECTYFRQEGYVLPERRAQETSGLVFP